jgi:hypothetical protein
MWLVSVKRQLTPQAKPSQKFKITQEIPNMTKDLLPSELPGFWTLPTAQNSK